MDNGLSLFSYCSISTIFCSESCCKVDWRLVWMSVPVFNDFLIGSNTILKLSLGVYLIASSIAWSTFFPTYISEAIFPKYLLDFALVYDTLSMALIRELPDSRRVSRILLGVKISPSISCLTLAILNLGIFMQIRKMIMKKKI